MKQRTWLLLVACLLAGLLVLVSAGCSKSPERKAAIAAGEAASAAWRRVYDYVVRQQKANTGAVKGTNVIGWVELELRSQQAADYVVRAARAKPVPSGLPNIIDGNQQTYNDAYNKVTNRILKIRELLDYVADNDQARKAVDELRPMVDEAERLTLVVGQTAPAPTPAP